MRVGEHLVRAVVVAALLHVQGLSQLAHDGLLLVADLDATDSDPDLDRVGAGLRGDSGQDEAGCGESDDGGGGEAWVWRVDPTWPEPTDTRFSGLWRVDPPWRRVQAVVRLGFDTRFALLTPRRCGAVVRLASIRRCALLTPRRCGSWSALASIRASRYLTPAAVGGCESWSAWLRYALRAHPAAGGGRGVVRRVGVAGLRATTHPGGGMRGRRCAAHPAVWGAVLRSIPASAGPDGDRFRSS